MDFEKVRRSRLTCADELISFPGDLVHGPKYERKKGHVRELPSVHFHRTALEAVLLVHQLKGVQVLFGVVFCPGFLRLDVEIASEPVRDRVIVERGDDRTLRRSSPVWVGRSGCRGRGSTRGGGDDSLLFGKGGVANRLRREDADNLGEVSVRAGRGGQNLTPGSTPDEISKGGRTCLLGYR